MVVLLDLSHSLTWWFLLVWLHGVLEICKHSYSFQ